MTSPADRQAEKQLVKTRSRLDEVAREVAGCEFTPRGHDDLWACCPFHNEDTPSFHVRPERGMFKCFGCGEAGDVFSFVQKMMGVDFRGALQFLADRSGITLGSLTPEERQAVQRAKRAREVLGAAGQLFGQCLRHPVGQASLDYMRQRGFRDEILDSFDIGHVPPDFLPVLTRSGVDRRDLEPAGFTRQFAGRVVFGIRDGHGSLVGFGARTLQEGERPKYVNTRETDAFNKRRLLYGFDKASRQLGRSGRLVIMEGYTDVMMAHQQGLTEAVATMGTSLTEDHLRLLKGRVSNLVLLFDGDRPGQDAAERAVRLALTGGLECRVLTLPEGQDPCDWFARHDLEAFEALLATRAESTVSFLCRRELEALDQGEPGGPERAARAVLEACRVLVEPLRRDAIVGEIARACSVDRNLLRAQTGSSRPGPASREGRSGERAAVSARVRCQMIVVACLARDAAASEVVAELDELGVLDHAGVRRLLELARQLDGGLPVDPVEWLERAREISPQLAGSLERALFPPPGLVLPELDEAASFLRRERERELGAQARRETLSRGDLAHDDAALRALQESLKAARAVGSAPPNNLPAGR